MLQQVCRGVDQSRFRLQNGGDAEDFGVRLIPMFLFDRFPDSRKSLRVITGINAGRINHVLVPRPARKSVGCGQKVFGLRELLIQILSSFGRQILSRSLSRYRLVALGACHESIESIVERREVQVWGNVFFGRRDARSSWIVDGSENAFCNLLVPFNQVLRVCRRPVS